MLYCFNKNEELIHEFGSGQLQKCTQIEELNKVMILEFSVYLSSYEARQALKDMEFVAHKDMENPEKIQMYRVISSETDSFTINFQAVHVLFDDLKSYGYIGNKKGENIKASSALELVLEGSRWKVGRVDDSVVKTLRFHYVNRLEGLSTILNTWGMELSYDLEFNGSIITARTVNLLAQRGEDTGERFVYGSNALEVVKELDKSEIYTQIVPRGKVEEKAKNELKTDNRRKMDNLRKRESPVSDRNVEEKEENRVDITSIGWSKAEGKPIDKPKGQEFIELSDRTKIFGYSDGKPRTKVVVFEDVEKPEDLIQAGYNYLVEVSRPLAQFKTKVYKKSLTNVGDIVRVIRKDLDIYYQTRIYKATRNILTGSVEVEFGDKLILSPGERQRNILDSIGALENRMERKEAELKGSFVDKVTEELTNATFNRDGFNYELKAGNKYKLPAGYYSFDREIDDNPQRVIYVGAGTLAIADSKKSNGDWNFRTFGTGKGFVADLLLAGTILGGKVRWNLEDGTFIIGNSTKDYNLYWDGGTLHLRNVDIDLENNRTIQNIQNNQSITNQSLEARKEEIEKAKQAIEDVNNLIEKTEKKRDKNLDDTQSVLMKMNDEVYNDLSNYKTKINKELLDIKSSVKITDDKISTSVESLNKIIETKDKDIKTYISKNYSSITQTDEKIRLKVGWLQGELLKHIDDVTSEFSTTVQTKKLIESSVTRINTRLDKAESKISQTADGISSKVSKNEIISEINQTHEQVKIKASKIDLTGQMNLSGSFWSKSPQTLSLKRRTLGTLICDGTIWFQESRNANTNVYIRADEDEQMTLSGREIYLAAKNRVATSEIIMKGEDIMIFCGGRDEYHKAIDGKMSIIANEIGLGADTHVAGKFSVSNSLKVGNITTLENDLYLDGSLHFSGNRTSLRAYTNGTGLFNSSGNGLFVSNSGDVEIHINGVSYEVATK